MDAIIRLIVLVQGTVQGVGFRPFVYQLAQELKLTGMVMNTAKGVCIEIEGSKATLVAFQERLKNDKPAFATIQSLDVKETTPKGDSEFTINFSQDGGSKSAWILPDLVICPNCLQELFDPTNRRYLYPFINCTHCGPRFSIIQTLPYDRPNTTMKHFVMCSECASEYQNPYDRRFHAQPTACERCGPSVELWDAEGKTLVTKHDAIVQMVEVLRAGQIVAVKGLGGFQLLVDASNEAAIQKLRKRKRRKTKPLAVMVPNLGWAGELCSVSDAEKEVLTSAAAPIVLMRSKHQWVAPSVSPGNPYLGVMLPTTPLHHLIMREFGKPVVATSGNLSDEPICIDEYEALNRLSEIADVFLVHNRPIVRPVDDSVVQVIDEQLMILRRARGYAPFPIYIGKLAASKTTLAVGSFLKNTIAVNSGANVFISQHIGDLETLEAQQSFESIINALQKIYELQPEQVAHDLHPDYPSTQYANKLGLPTVGVQHHYAHVLACMAEHDLLDETMLGASWDGTGLGTDNTIWGSEFLMCSANGFQRVAHLLPFQLPSGDQAIYKPYRIAYAILHQVFGCKWLDEKKVGFLEKIDSTELKILEGMIKNNFNCPTTSSMGRLFDAVSAIIGCCFDTDEDGQAAMLLEFALTEQTDYEHYPFELIQKKDIYVIDWRPMIHAIVDDVCHNVSRALISQKFHHTLVEIIVIIAQKLDQTSIILTGGCFQNRYLLTQAICRLRQENIQPYWSQLIPVNDGGIALGQLIATTCSPSAPLE